MSGWQRVALDEIARLTWRGEAPDPERKYRLIGVRWWGEGAYEYKTLLGSETQAPALYRVEENDLIINKIWARHGSIAVADRSLVGTHGSSEFPTFVLDTRRVIPRFIHWFSKTSDAWAQCAALSQGTSGKNRVKPERFLTVSVPLPSLDAQRTLVARLDAAAAAVTARSNEAATVDAEIAATLRAAFATITAGAPRKPMGEVAPLVRRQVTIDPDATYSEIGVRSFFRGLFVRRTVKGEEFDWQKLYRVERDDIVFSNLMAWEKAIGLASAEFAGTVGNHRMLTCEVDKSRVTAAVLHYFFTTDDGFQQILRASPGTMVRNKTLSTKLLPAIEVPVPSLDGQHWFGELQAKAAAAKAAQAEAGAHLDRLLPAMLHEVFGG